MDIALANDLTTRDNGTLVTNVDNIITKVFNSMDIQLKGNNDYYYIKSSIRSIVTNDRPFILHIPSHSTVAKGYVTYEVKYQEKYWSWFKYKWRTVTKIEEFAVISEGWGHSTPRYYDIELIDKNCKKLNLLLTNSKITRLLRRINVYSFYMCNNLIRFIININNN